ncbi:MAG: type II toxin-antitoxin system PemK/MazF family toxin [Oscillospiraceae bacterium]
MKYKRGDIVLVEMGYNVGNEQGGKRYAVVIEKNPVAQPVVTIVPIATLGGTKTRERLHESEVFLGEVLPGADSYAIPLHARAISKLRIIKPKAPPALAKLSVEQLDAIDAVIASYFTKNT